MSRDRVKVEIGRTISLPNYENIKFSVGVEADVREEEVRKDVFKKLLKEAEGYLDQACAPVEENRENYNARRKGK
jgi:hypothetical protein